MVSELHRKTTKKSDLQAALADFDRAIGINPDLVNAYAFLGLIHLALANDKAARRDFDRCLSLRPGLRPFLDAEITKVLGAQAKANP